MASFDDVTFFDPAAPGGAAIFRLSQQRFRSAYSVVVDGWTVDVLPGARWVVARGGSAATREEALGRGAEVAHRALDLLSYRRSLHLTVVDADRQNITCWTENGRGIARIVDVGETFTPTISGTLTVRNADGTDVAPAPPPPTGWDPSFRYFRLSQATDDLFEAYRNLYLAFESILSLAHPFTGGREKAWLLAALAVVNSRVPLATYATAGAPDPAQDIHDCLYAGVRNNLFHAKRGRSHIPYDPSARASISAALPRMAHLYLALADTYAPDRRARSSFSQEVKTGMLTAFFEQARLWVAPDDVPDADTLPDEARMTWLTDGRFEVTPGTRALLSGALAGAAGAPITNARRVRSFGAARGREAGAADNLHAVLDVNGLSRLEVEMTFTLVERTEPRTAYPG